MRNSLLFALALFFLFFLCSCGHYSEGHNEYAANKIRQSYHVWLDKKEEYANYSYTFIDYDDAQVRNWQTTIYVEKGEITCRYFQAIDNLSITVWLEAAKLNTLNTHAEGSPLRTLDQRYGDCSLLALHDHDSKLFVTVFEDGLLNSCYIPNEYPYPNYSRIKIENILKRTCPF